MRSGARVCQGEASPGSKIDSAMGSTGSGAHTEVIEVRSAEIPSAEVLARSVRAPQAELEARILGLPRGHARVLWCAIREKTVLRREEVDHALGSRQNVSKLAAQVNARLADAGYPARLVARFDGDWTWRLEARAPAGSGGNERGARERPRRAA
jgi:hypothetical protein